MAFRTYPLTVAVPPGTLPTAPLITPWKTEDATIVSIEIVIPPGHNGLTGIRFVKGDAQILPFGINSWIIANDIFRVFPVGAFTPTGDLAVWTYNQGVYTHTFYILMTVEDYTPSIAPVSASETAALALTSPPGSTDPLSPDALLGPATAALLASGDLTAADIAPVDLTAGTGAPSGT